MEVENELATHLHTMRAPPKREGMRTDGAMAATEVLHNEPRQGSGLGADGLSLAQPRQVKKCVRV